MAKSQAPLVDINHASKEALIAVRGIGPVLAKTIIDHRPYQTLHDLVDIPGINEKKLALLLPHLALEKKQKPEGGSKQSVKKTADVVKKPVAKFGETEAFVFLEDRNERLDALLMVLGGFIVGLLALLIHRSRQ
jgi:competence protein ComEA